MKTAICFGINYPGTSSQLSGCVNDAMDWATMLTARGFAVDIITDKEATKVKMVQAIKDVVSNAKYGDKIVVTYSGHGTYVRDRNGDEADGNDEAICPVDVFSGQIITDDELYELFSDRPLGVRLVFISDSCHSGTVTRFAPDFGHHVMTPKVRFLPPGDFLPKDLRPIVGLAKGTFKSTALLLSGCRDTEFSYDAWFGNRANGAFTRAALDAMVDLNAKSRYIDWYAAVRRRLPTSQYPQNPGLYGTTSQKRWSVL